MHMPMNNMHMPMNDMHMPMNITEEAEQTQNNAYNFYGVNSVNHLRFQKNLRFSQLENAQYLVQTWCTVPCGIMYHILEV